MPKYKGIARFFKGIARFILWLCALTITGNELLRIFYNKENYQKELKKFYDLLSDRNDAIQLRNSEINEISPHIRNILFFLIIILFAIVHIRIRHLKEMDSYVKKIGKSIRESETSSSKSSSKSKLFILITIICGFLFLKEMLEIFAVLFEDYEKKKIKLLSPEKRVQRLSQKINDHEKNKSMKE